MPNEALPKNTGPSSEVDRTDLPKRKENWFQTGTKWLSAIGGLVALYSVAEYHVSTKSRLNSLETGTEKIRTTIDKETDLRKMYWADLFVYRKDSTNSHNDSTLEYEIRTDQLNYVPKRK